MDTQQELVGPISQIVSVAISEYVSRDRMSLRQLAKSSGVSYSYVRRLAEQEISDEKIEPTKLFPVLTKAKGTDFACMLSRLFHELVTKNVTLK